jgi:hypothetical protein
MLRNQFAVFVGLLSPIALTRCAAIGIRAIMAKASINRGDLLVGPAAAAMIHLRRAADVCPRRKSAAGPGGQHDDFNHEYRTTRVATGFLEWKEIDDKTFGEGFDCFAKDATCNLGVADLPFPRGVSTCVNRKRISGGCTTVISVPVSINASAPTVAPNSPWIQRRNLDARIPKKSPFPSYDRTRLNSIS